jgi:alpha-amylase
VTVAGYGEKPVNTWGHRFWMLAVDMDCSRRQDGWFGVQVLYCRGLRWEGDVRQPGAPRPSGYHFARCGWLRVFACDQAEPIAQGQLEQ